MKENPYENNMNEQDEEKINYQELLFRYIIHWPWFVASVLVCLIGAWVYLHFQTPVYQVSASIMIKDDKKGSGSTDLGNLGIGGVITSTQGIDNEIEVLRSKTILKEVVNNLELYITYYDEDEFPEKELYQTSPVIVNLTAQEADKLPGSALLAMKLSPEGVLDVNLKVGLNEYNQRFEKLPAVLPTDAGTFGFALKDSLSGGQMEGHKGERHIRAVVSRPFGVAKGYQGALSIAPTSRTTSVAVVSLMNTNIQRARDFINKLMEMYNRNTNNDKNEVAEKTREFINERIKIIDEELGSTEDKLEAFKRNAGLTDISSDAQLAVSGNAEYEKRRVDNGTQINLVRDLIKYINNPLNEYELLPGNIGLSDAGLTTQIGRYNELIIERKRLLRTSTESNPMIVNLDTSIRAMKSNVQAAINGTLQGLLIVKADLEREAGRFSRRISDAPGQERQYVSIARQQEIKAGLYLMLLQKREENAITLAATANNAKIIDEPVATGGPLSPKPNMIYMIALVLGVGMPVGVIFLIGLTKFKIEGRGDVEKLTRLPIVGDVPLTTERTGSIAVFENQNNLMSETFRNVRTNLQFMLENDQKVILVTSTISGEGKSFVASNLAISLSLLGKKVVIVGLDIRKPGLNKVFNISRKEQGITQYLSNPEKNLMDFVQVSDVSKSLYILPGGTVPPNPTELLARDGLDKAVETLKKNFDYVILDTAPIGMVTDTLLIGRVADLAVYVCRADYTRKAEYTLINELAENNKLPNLCTIINGLDLQKKKYGYYYGYGKYGKYYGYGKRYGYGYGYGEHKIKEE
ncbi:polysaccharide biosynthesis tyrosine autokinase [Bacteroides sp. NSJ-39]|mgnify:FL=1|jgi:capsular exopolysaccharide family|uniref:GumC family protein n=1 Tax=Bacteroides sp. NSJ-39 TaxID=2763019 RepID=UPI00164A2453|nr:polysaccharide biosynthesis tyrosine autokinase [Bacteroides sp. NSJ-39]MBC5587027.1 polysaccharide biosynthesis tyrosine autokinase [Bacteroides sp. NSJ-39]